MSTTKKITIFAPAKINLFLHLTGKLSNGYHTLDSLVSFADIGDLIEIEEAKSFSFHIKGEFAGKFNKSDSCKFLDGDNLIVKAARSLSQITDKPLNLRITLAKNLPIASGIGGGSSDAATTIWGLQEFWGLKHNPDYIDDLLLKLGADVPVCFNASARIMRGIGDELLPAPITPEIPILLVNPLISCSTAGIFMQHNGRFKDNVTLPDQFNNARELAKYLQRLSNDLYKPSVKIIPKIHNVINALDVQEGCLLSRMSGSGATCFAIFNDITSAQAAQEEIKLENPDWWVKSGWLNRAERY